MQATLRFSGVNKNKIICKHLPTDFTVESSIAADTVIINSLLVVVLLLPFKHHNNTSQYAKKRSYETHST